jgi:hypothetical protein
MEKKKKNDCGCFGFLRKRKQTPAKCDAAQQTKFNNTQFASKLPEENISVDQSSRLTQKLLTSTINFRSSIITPLRFTPQTHRFLSSVALSKPTVLCSDAKNPGTTPPLNYRNTENVPIIPALPESNDIPMRNDISLSPDYNHITSPKNIDFLNDIPEKTPESLTNPIEIHLKLNESAKKHQKFEFHFAQPQNGFDFINKIPEEVSGSVPLNSDKHLESPSNFSPGLFSNPSKPETPQNLPALEISPIKTSQSIDDYSDIVSILNNPEKLKIIPDIFIRNIQRPRQLPVLKPTTPHYCTRRRILPSINK